MPQRLIPDEVAEIRSLVFTNDPGSHFRKSWPAKWAPTSTLLKRAYYVWRWARFHGGLDTRLPILASQIGDEDPCQETLDSLANTLAQEIFGTNMLGAFKWREILSRGPPRLRTVLRLVS